MVVACPACHTRYRVDGSVTLAGETSFECSQEECKHVFVYSPPVLWKGNLPAAAGRPVDSAIEDSSFQKEPATRPASEFLSRGTDVQTITDQTLGAQLPRMTDGQEAVEDVTQKRGSHSAQDVARDSVPLSNEEVSWWRRPERAVEPSFVPVPSNSLTTSHQEEEDDEHAPKFAYREEAEHNEKNEQETEQQYGQYELEEGQHSERQEAFLPLHAVFLLLASFVLGYAVLGYYAVSDLQETKLTLRNLPFVGNAFAAEPFSLSHITLTELRGSFWLSKDNRRVFAVAGTAINNASSPARLVQIEGTLYDQVGQKVRQEIVFCGNEANGNLLQSLTVRDIETLQNLVPPKDFRIPAGQVANCLLVFTKPPATVAELGGRVVSAQFEEPHGPLASVQPGEVDSRVGSPQRPPRL